MSNDESAKSLEFNNLFNSGTLRKEIEEAKNMTKQAEIFSKSVNFELENKKELGLFFKVTDTLSSIMDKSARGILVETENLIACVKGTMEACNSFAFMLRDDYEFSIKQDHIFEKGTDGKVKFKLKPGFGLDTESGNHTGRNCGEFEIGVHQVSDDLSSEAKRINLNSDLDSPSGVKFIHKK